MTTRTDVYRVVTPYGPIEVYFPEDVGVEYSGNPLAVDYLHTVIRQGTNSQGQSMTPDSLEPVELLHFCQRDGVSVFEPEDDALDPLTNPAPDMTTPTLDDAQTDTLATLRQSLKNAVGIMAKIAVMGQMVGVMMSKEDAIDRYAAEIAAAGLEFLGAVNKGYLVRLPNEETANARIKEDGGGQWYVAQRGMEDSQLMSFGAAVSLAKRQLLRGTEDDAVAMGEKPRNSTSHLYDFDPNRKQGQRKRDNAAAMALLESIDAGDVDPLNLSDDQKQALAKYSGTGGALIGANGKKGSAYEYYTPKPIAEGCWALLTELGFAGGRVSDPCAATGVFGATAPLNAAIDAVELNATSGRVNALVNDGPGYKAIVSPYEAVAAATPDEVYDAVVTNVPFGDVGDRGGNQFKDPRYQKEPIQNYFILRSLEKLRPGGLALFITPPRCVSGKGGKEEALRVSASYMAEFMGAYRLPNKVFGTAAADTMTDVIVFRKFSREVLDRVAELKEQNPKTLTDANVIFGDFIAGNYFKSEGVKFILGTVEKAKGQWGEVDVLNSDLTMPEIAKLMRRFPHSRINWDLLNAAETAPIAYLEGDTINHAGQTLQMKAGRWVALDSVAANDDRAAYAAMLEKLSTALGAVQNQVTWTQAQDAVAWMVEHAQALDIPNWLRGAVADLLKLPEGQRGTYWSAGISGMAVLEVMGHHQAEQEGFNYEAEYADLSDKIKRVAADAKKPPTRLSGLIRDGMARIGVIFDKKAGFSAVWRGDVVTREEDTRSESERVEALKYRNGSLFVSIDDARTVYGQNFDPVGTSEWCVSADGKSVAKSSDYYVGNYAEFLRKIDGQIADATDPVIRDKLLRQKADADNMVDRVDATKMSFNLFTPFVAMEEKVDFLRRFVDPRFALAYDEDGKAYIECDIKVAQNEREKLYKRFAQYLKNGTHSLGGIDVVDDKAAMAALRTMTTTANEQFNSWVKANNSVMSRLHKTANDPERLYFRQVDDESPMDIPGLNPDWKMHGYQNAFIRKTARNFSGINGDGVGLGKTAQALAAVQYAQSIGVKSRTIFVVPNSVLSNWRKESGRVYASTDDCLYVGLTQQSDGKFKVDSKQYDKDLMRILENRHSKVFMTMEAFQRLRLREETAALYDSYLASVDSSYAESDQNKKNEKTKSKREELIYQLTTDSAKSAAAPYFEDLGIDSVVIDEAHAYKNAANVNEFKGGKFLSMAEASNRGLDAQAKCWYVRRSSGDRSDGVLCLTATPVTNSPLEIYSMLALSSGHKRLNDMMMGIKGADHFMDTMCRLDNEDEETIDGKVKAYDVFKGLANVGVLRGAIYQVCTIRTSKDVGAQIKVPAADETPVAVSLPDDVVETLSEYKEAFRFAMDTIMEKSEVGGSQEAYEKVAAKFGEPMELIAHPFNLINKMTVLIQDPELDKRGTFYDFKDEAVAEKVVADYNAKAPIEDRPREGPQTRPDAVVGTKTKKDGDNEIKLLRIKAMARIEGNRIVLDSTDADTQARFEAVADKAGLDLDVTIPPKLAAMIQNLQREEASPRGIGADGNPTGRVKQLIFCDVLAMHAKIRRLLVKKCGVSAGSIAVITGSVNGKPEEIIDVQDGFNAEGDENRYRYIIANEKAEVGINLQRGTQAIHHLTIGWTPDSLTQRNGRGVRQGNQTERVTVYHYDADGTFDTYKRMLVGKKSNWIDAVMDKDGESDVNVEGGLSKQQLEELVNSIGDAAAIGKSQERAEAADKAARAATTKAKQVVNLQTALAQAKFVKDYEKPEAWAADKLSAYMVLGAQASSLKFRLDNPKLTAATLLRTQSLLADVETRAAGLKKALEDALIVRQETRTYSGGTTVSVGEPMSLEAIIQSARGYPKRGEKVEEKAANWLRGARYGYQVEIKPGSAIENEWQSEMDMARQMVAESRKGFADLALKDGGYSADILTRVDNGEAQVIDGKVICAGAFIRVKSGALLVIWTPTSGGFMASGVHELKFRSMAAADAIRGGEVILPGSPGHDDCVTDAAKIEDAVFGAGVMTDAILSKLYSAHVPQVAQRRTATADIKYAISEYRLPPPFFPIVIDDKKANESGTRVVKAIFEQQSQVVKSISHGYPESFVVESTVSVDAVTGSASTVEKLLHEYAAAHGLKVTKDDMSALGVYGIGRYWMYGSDTEADDFTESVIDSATTPEELDSRLAAWIRKELSTYDLDGDGSFAASPLNFLRSLSASLAIAFASRRSSLAIGKTPEQAQVSADTDPNRMVGINGDTKAWKDNIKSVAASMGGRAIWDGNAECWNVTHKAWLELLKRYPAAEKALNMVESSGKTSYGRRRR